MCMLMSLSSCNKTQSSSSQNSIDQINIHISKSGGAIYIYKDIYDTFSKLNAFTSFIDPQTISLDAPFTSINIDCEKYYNDMTSDFLNKMFTLVTSYKHKVSVNFINAKDYNFLKTSQFEKLGLVEYTFQNQGEFIASYYNFEHPNQVDFFRFQFVTDKSAKKVPDGVVLFLNQQITDYQKRQ